MTDISLSLVILLIISIIFSGIIESISLPRIIYIAKKKNLYDIPSKRKAHRDPVPRLGGVTFFPILLFVISIFVIIYSTTSTPESILKYEPTMRRLFGLIGGSLLLWFVGVRDDIVGVRYRDKMRAQLFAAILLTCSGLYINDFNGLFGLREIPEWAGIPFTVLLIMFITNSINLIDGTDGLASGISGVAFISLGILFLINNMFFYSLVCAILVGVLIPFFYYNVFKTTRKVFMGDTGSLTLGFILAYLGIRFAMNTPETYGKFHSPVIISLSILFIPLFDALRVMIGRAMEGKSMFLPDRRHIHHKLLDLGYSHRKVMVSLVIYASLLAATNVFLSSRININLLFALDFLFWFEVILLLNIMLKRKRKEIIA